MGKKMKKVKGVLSVGVKSQGEYKLGSISAEIAKSAGKKKPKYDAKLFEMFSRKSSPPPPAPPLTVTRKDDDVVDRMPRPTTSRKFHQQFDYENEKDQNKPVNTTKSFKQVFSKFSNPTKKLKVVDKEVKLSNKDAAGIRIEARNKIRSEPEDEEMSSDQDDGDDNDDEETEEKVEEESKKDGKKNSTTTSTKTLMERNAPKPKDEEQESRTIFVGNVPKEMSQNQLLKLFKNYPGIENCRFRCGAPSKPTTMKRIAINKKQIHPDISTIVAFIRFEDRTQAEKAQEGMNGYQLYNDHHLKVDLATNDKKERDDKKAIFIGNLHMKITDNELWQAFEECGKIENVRVIRDRESGCGKGFGYVNFKDSSSVESALLKDTIELKGRPMRVSRIIKKVIPKDKSRVRDRNKVVDNHNPAAVTTTTTTGKGAKIKTKNKKIKIEDIPFPRNKKIKFEDNEQQVEVKPNKKKLKLEKLREKMEMKDKRRRKRREEKTLTDDGILAGHGKVKVKKAKKRDKGVVMKVKIAKKLELSSGDKTSKKKEEKGKI